MRQALVRDDYTAKILYYYFKHLNILKLKNSKLESCRSHRAIQFLYKNHLHPTPYLRVMNYVKLSLVTPGTPGGATY